MRRKVVKNRYHPTPSSFYSAAYGDGWIDYGVTEWKDAYRRHDASVRRVFCDLPQHSPSRVRAAAVNSLSNERLLEIDVTTMGKQGRVRFFFLKSRSMLTANAEDRCRSEGTQRRVSPRPFRRLPPPDSI